MMNESELKAIVGARLQDALGYDADELTDQRSDAWERYLGEAYGDEVEGRSSVISRDVMETVEAVMPSLVRIFLGTDEVVRFDPTGPEDEAVAEQATEYVNYVIKKDNPGFAVLRDWMKSALLYKVGAVKIYWDEADETKTQVIEGLTEEGLALVVNDENVEVLEQDQYPGPMGMAYSVKIAYTQTKGRVKIEALPPEEFLVDRNARSLDDAKFICHRSIKTRSDLLEMGFDEDLIDDLPSNESDDFLEEREERNNDLEYGPEDDHTVQDESMRRHWIYECYLAIDYNQDGIAEWRKITVGSGAKPVILDNEEMDEHPFAALCPVPAPHRFYGQSLYDLSKDIQRLKTTIWRMMLDGMYHSIFPRREVNIDRIEDIDDVVSQAPDSLIFKTGDNPVLTKVENSWDGAQAFPMMEYVDRVLESRTGVTALGSGLDANVLQNQAATAVNEAAQAARARIELIAREFAETGFTTLFRKVLRLVVKYQDRERTVRLSNKWVPMDPRSWNADMDVTVSVGLGTGNRDQQLQRLNLVAQKQEQILLNMGPQNPLAPLDKYYNTLREMVRLNDLADPDRFFSNPAEAPPQPPQPNPDMIKAQAEQQREQAKLHLEQQKMQQQAALEDRKAQQMAEIERMKAENELVLGREKAAMDAEIQRQASERQYALEVDKMEREFAMRQQELAMEAELERMKMAAGSRDGQGNINTSD